MLRTRLGRIDVMQWISVVSYQDLVTLKQIAGRPEDLTDLERLRQARGEE